MRIAHAIDGDHAPVLPEEVVGNREDRHWPPLRRERACLAEGELVAVHKGADAPAAGVRGLGRPALGGESGLDVAISAARLERGFVIPQILRALAVYGRPVAPVRI